MKNKVTIPGVAAAVLAAIVGGCATTPPVDTTAERQPKESATLGKNEQGGEHKQRTREDVRKDIEAGREVELPENYRQKENWHTPSLLVTVDTEPVGLQPGDKVGRLLPNIDKTIVELLESRLEDLKRFNVYIRDSKGIRLIREGAALGLNEPLEEKTPDFGFIADLKIRTLRKSYRKQNGLYEFKWDIVFDCKILNAKTREPRGKPARMTVTTPIAKDVLIDFDGKWQSGTSVEDMSTWVYNAADTAMQGVWKRVANEFPVNANVTSISKRFGGRCAIDKGFEQGINKGSVLIIWGEFDGIPVAIGYGIAQPEQDQSSVKILAWQKGADYEEVAREVLTPGWLDKPGNKLYVTTDQIAPPPSWQSSSKK